MEGFADFGDLVGDNEGAVFDFIADHHRRDQGEAFSLAGEQTEHGHVIDLGQDERAHGSGGEDAVETSADVAGVAGQDQGDVGKVIGEAQAFAFPFRRANEGDGLIGEAVAVPGALGIAVDGIVAEHEVDFMRLQGDEQLGQRAGAEHEFHFRAIEDGGDEFEEEIPRERGDSPHAQDLAGGTHAVAHDVHEFLAGAADGIGVIERQSSGFREFQSAVFAIEERMAEAFFQLFQLHAEGRWGEVELFRGAGEIEFAGDDAEVAQVMVVEEIHGVFMR